MESAVLSVLRGRVARTPRVPAVVAAMGFAVAALGDQAAARELTAPCYEALRLRLTRERDNVEVLWTMALIEGALGQKEDAMAHVRRAAELARKSASAVIQNKANNRLALVYAWGGEKDRAVAEAERMLRTPFSQVTVAMMRHDPFL